MWIEKQLAKRAKEGTMRSLHLADSLIDLTSNDYLGFARSIDFSLAIIDKWQKTPHLGSTGSRLLTGNSAFAEHLEKEIAQFHGFESGLLFTCGYMANLGLFFAIAGPDDCILFDTDVHASTRDGIRLSQARAYPFRHNDLDHLENRLKKIPGCFVCVESLYSIDGTLAPLKEIANLCATYNAHLIVDEAHAVGIYGPQGRGRVFEEGLCEQVFAMIVGFGKALGSQGAIVLGNHLTRKALINFSRSFIYTTAASLPSLFAIETAYEQLPHKENERQVLRSMMIAGSPIHPISIPGPQAVRHCSHFIAQAGIDIRPILPPTVKPGQECLRLCIHAFNTTEELKRVFELIDLWKD